ncbi:hypothetical protein GCM10027418_25560 [Mariniluteicoccus endophyticus]
MTTTDVPIGRAPAGGLMPLERAECLSAVFKVLSDPTRVRLLALISGAPGGTACACDLTEELGISQPTLSHHLKRLTEAGLITREQRGRWAHYTAVPGTLNTARGFLGDETAGSERCC